MNKIIHSLRAVNFIFVTDGAGPCRDRDMRAITRVIHENIESWVDPRHPEFCKLNMLVITEAEVFHWTSEPIYALTTTITDGFKSFGMFSASRKIDIIMERKKK